MRLAEARGTPFAPKTVPGWTDGWARGSGAEVCAEQMTASDDVDHAPGRRAGRERATQAHECCHAEPECLDGTLDRCGAPDEAHRIGVGVVSEKGLRADQLRGEGVVGEPCDPVAHCLARAAELVRDLPRTGTGRRVEECPSDHPGVVTASGHDLTGQHDVGLVTRAAPGAARGDRASTIERAQHPSTREAPRNEASATARAGDLTGGQLASEPVIVR